MGASPFSITDAVVLGPVSSFVVTQLSSTLPICHRVWVLRAGRRPRVTPCATARLGPGRRGASAAPEPTADGPGHSLVASEVLGQA